MGMITFLDLDGTCADFHASASRLAGISPITSMADRAMGERIQCSYHLETFMGMDIWQKIEAAGVDFWAELAPTPWLNDMVEVISRASDELYVLTTPMHIAAAAVPGKIEWCRKYLPRVPGKNIIFTGQKQLLAGPGRLLVDDADDVVEQFRLSGGQAFCVPQPWNRRRADTVQEVPTLLRAFLTSIQACP